MNNKEHSDRHRRQVSAGSHRALWGHEKNFPSSSHEQAKPVKDFKQGSHIMRFVCLFLSPSGCHVNYGWQKNTAGREETRQELLRHSRRGWRWPEPGTWQRDQKALVIFGVHFGADKTSL